MHRHAHTDDNQNKIVEKNSTRATNVKLIACVLKDELKYCVFRWIFNIRHRSFACYFKNANLFKHIDRAYYNGADSHRL